MRLRYATREYIHFAGNLHFEYGSRDASRAFTARNGLPASDETCCSSSFSYEACFAIAGDIPSRAIAPAILRLYDGLYLQNKIIGFLSWRAAGSVAGAADSTFNFTEARKLTNPLEIYKQPSSLRDESGSFVDSIYPDYTIRYTLTDRECDLNDLYTAIIEGMAIASLKDKDNVADDFTALSATGNFAIHIHGPPQL